LYGFNPFNSAVYGMQYTVAQACTPRMLFANSQLRLPIAEFFSARSVARLSTLKYLPKTAFSPTIIIEKSVITEIFS